MLLQAMLMLAALLVIGSALLTSTLVSAKAAFHQTIQRKSETAMNEATADFVTWAQEHVKNDGLNQTSVWSAVPQQEPPAPTCASGDSVSPATDIEGCSLMRQIRWNVTGYTGDVQNNAASQGLSEASALATAQEEQRVSATVSVVITDKTGQLTYDNRSREITARLFHAFPYVAVSGSKDVLSATGDRNSSEGDTAGHENTRLVFEQNPSARTLPATNSNTTIVTTIDCANTAQDASSDPLLDDNEVTFSALRSYGNLVWAYEVPCKSRQPIDPATIPQGYTPPNSSDFMSNAQRNLMWFKRDDDNSSFSH